MFVPFRRFLAGLRRKFMQRLFVILHGTLGCYHRYALQGGGAAIIACLPARRASVPCFPFIILLCWWIPLLSS
jgi:hypothetical protein